MDRRVRDGLGLGGWRVGSFKIGVKREATLGRKFLFIDTTRLSTLQPRTLKDGEATSTECFGFFFGFPRCRDIGAPSLELLLLTVVLYALYTALISSTSSGYRGNGYLPLSSSKYLVPRADARRLFV